MIVQMVSGAAVFQAPGAGDGHGASVLSCLGWNECSIRGFHFYHADRSDQLIRPVRTFQQLQISVFDLPMSKNGRPRRIFLNSVAREIVETARGDHPEFVFVFRGRTDKGRIAKPFTKLNNTAWKRARQEVGLEHCRGEGMHLRVHDLRHTFATRLREAGVSREDRKDLLGHVNDDITTHYSAAETMTMIGMVERLVESAEKPALYLVHNTQHTVGKS